MPRRIDPTLCTPQTLQRFLRHVENADAWGRDPHRCTLWLGNHLRARESNQHGTFKLGGEPHYAHRVAFLLYYGHLDENLLVLHSCRSGGRCVNPLHLRQGTALDNARDRRRDGTTAAGENHPKAKLTEMAVWDIRRRRAAGESLARLAELYDIGVKHVYDIVRRRAWSHIE